MPQDRSDKKKQSTKDEPKVDGKKSKKAQLKADLMLLAEEEQTLRNQRIKARFLGALGIGVIMDMMDQNNGSSKDGPPSSGKKPKKEKTAEKEDVGFTKKLESLAGPIMMIALILGIFVLKLGEDSWVPSADSGTNYYEVMGVPRDASVMDVKKAYKKLALTWHPDKNPNCSACPERFAAISEANEVLSDPDRRQAYDSNVRGKTKLQTASSEDLTLDDFQAKVLRSNEIWIVQLYDPSREASNSFHAEWEEVATKQAKVARFGRINFAKYPRVVDFLPQRVMATPAVFKFGRGVHPELFVFDKHEEGPGTLIKWVQDACPPMKSYQSSKDVKIWRALETPRVLIAGAPVSKFRGKRKEQWLAAQHAAFTWGDFFDFNVVDSKFAQEVLGDEFVPINSDKTWSVIIAGGKNEALQSHEARDTEELSEILHANLETRLTVRAPFITVRNYRQLCAARGDELRTYCLFLVNLRDAEVLKLVSDLEKSKDAYHQEVLDLKSSDEDGEGASEEPFRIQPVRITTSSSRFPWVPDCPDWRKFTGDLWNHVGRSPTFLLELETSRIVALKSKALVETYQGIAYEDLSLKELPEDGSPLVTVLPDPESSLSAELRGVLTSVIGALAALLLLAGAFAVFPELSPPVSAAISAGIFLFLLVCWPAACRRFLGKLLMY